MSILVLAMVLVLVVSSAVAAAAKPNLFANGDLEQPNAAGDWPLGWSSTQWGETVGEFIYEKGDAHSGNRAVKVGDWYDGGWGAALSSPTVQVDAGRKYILSFWYKTAGLTGPKQAMVQIRFMRPQGELRMSKGLANVTEWTPFTLQLDLPPGTTSLGVRIGQFMRTQGWVYVDDVSLREATPADLEARVGLPERPPLIPVRQVPAGEVWEATNRYRVEERNGAWWLVDTQGRPTLSIGTVMNYPWDSNPDLLSWTRRNYPDQTEYYKYAFNLAAQWGFNSLAGWSDEANTWALSRYSRDPELPRMQHFAVINFAKLGGPQMKATNNKGQAKHGDHAFPDPYNPEWRAMAKGRMMHLAFQYRSHPQFVGYFVDNELDITQLYRYVWGTYSSKKFIEFLEERYGDFARLAEAWQLAKKGIKATSFADLLTVKPEPASYSDPCLPDFKDFAREMYAEYVNFVVGLVREADPSHLVIGPRPHEGISAETMEYADLMSAFDIVAVNDYPENTGILGLGLAQQEYLERVHRLTGRPILIGEFSIPARDSGLYEKEKLDWSWPDAVATQEERADAYEATFRWLMSRPYVVGVHWFMWHDLDHPDPNQRRANRGLIGRDHKPWQVLVERMQQLHKEVLP